MQCVCFVFWRNAGHICDLQVHSWMLMALMRVCLTISAPAGASGQCIGVVPYRGHSLAHDLSNGFIVESKIGI